MLVFRCECEQVLGVDNDSNKGGMGECPTCGRIIRVPASLVNASGRLRLAGAPARAMSASGAFRQIRETPKNGSAIPNVAARTNGASASSAKSAPVFAAAVAESASATTKLAPPVPLKIEAPAPTPSKTITPDMGVKTPVSDPIPDAPTEIGMQLLGLDAAAETVTAKALVPDKNKANVTSGRKDKPGSVKKLPVKSQKLVAAQSDSNDPNAAVETKNDRTIAAVANAAASKRGKAESASAAPAKKNWVLIYMIGVVVVLAILGICYALGVFSKDAPKPSTTPGTSTQTNKVTTPAATVETKPAVTTEPKPDAVKPPESTDAKPPADAAKKDPAADTKADDTKKEEKKDPAADAKTDEKKTNA